MSINLSGFGDFSAVFSSLALFYDKKLDDTLVFAYYNILKDYPLEEVRQAILAHVASDKCAYFPRPGDLVCLMVGDPETRAIKAFGKVSKAAKLIEHHIVFDDPLIHMTIDQLSNSWYYFLEDDITYKKKDFIRIYCHQMSKAMTEYPNFLLGGNKNRIPPQQGVRVVLVGNKERALGVYHARPPKCACGQYQTCDLTYMICDSEGALVDIPAALPPSAMIETQSHQIDWSILDDKPGDNPAWSGLKRLLRTRRAETEISKKG